jgi:hypothetical protein
MGSIDREIIGWVTTPELGGRLLGEDATHGSDRNVQERIRMSTYIQLEAFESKLVREDGHSDLLGSGWFGEIGLLELWGRDSGSRRRMGEIVGDADLGILQLEQWDRTTDQTMGSNDGLNDGSNDGIERRIERWDRMMGSTC